MSKVEIAPTGKQDKTYLRTLFILLGAVTFFEGFDSALSAVVLRDLAETFDIDASREAALGGPIFAIALGALAGVLVARIGDRVGRKPLLVASTASYALLTGLTATAPSIQTFMLYQFLAKAFLVASLVGALVVVIEEFPVSSRGKTVGALLAFSALGLPVAAAMHSLLPQEGLGWRWLYLIGVLPLLLAARLAVKMKETTRWQTARRTPTSGGIFAGGYLRQVLQISALFFLTHMALLGAITWWRWYAERERALPEATVTTMLATGYIAGFVGYLVAGYMQDRIGRRATGLIFLVSGAAAGMLVFQASSERLMIGSLFLAGFFGFGVSAVTNTLAAEMFPTERRATALAFARSIFGTMGAIAGPVLVALFADEQLGFMPTVGDSVSLLVLLYLPAALILFFMPETGGREIETIAAAARIAAPTPEFAYPPTRVTMPQVAQPRVVPPATPGEGPGPVKTNPQSETGQAEPPPFILEGPQGQTAPPDDKGDGGS